MDDPPGINEQLVIEITEDHGIVTVRPSGEIDMATSPTLQDALLSQIRNRPAVLIVDLESVRFLASTGLSVLAFSDHAARDSGIEMRVVASSPIVIRTLQLTGLVDLLAVFRSYADALVGKPTPPIRTP